MPTALTVWEKEIGRQPVTKEGKREKMVRNQIYGSTVTKEAHARVPERMDVAN